MYKYSTLLGAAALALGAAASTAATAAAQSAGGSGAQGGRAAASTRIDTVVVQRMSGERHDAILALVDSLRRELETATRTSPEYARLVQEFRSAVTQLAVAHSHLRVHMMAPQAPDGEREQRIMFMPRTALAAARAMAPMPNGFIGLNVEAPYRFEVRGDSAYIQYFARPSVVSVEPNSPAEQAGIVPGDVVAAYNGRDLVEHEVNLTKLLRPRSRITVTVRRDGTARQYAMTVAEAPMALSKRRVISLGDSDEVAMRTPMPSEEHEWAAMPRAFVMTPSLDPSRAPVAGASVVAIEDEALGRPFGVTSGLLVTSVADGPARRAGLAGGDVIVAAEGRELRTVGDLRRILAAHADDREVALRVIRQRAPRTITVRW